MILFRGHGVPPDPKRGAELFRQAAEKGAATAQNRLARCYAHGAGVEQSLVEAAKWNFIAKAGGIDDPDAGEDAGQALARRPDQGAGGGGAVAGSGDGGVGVGARDHASGHGFPLPPRGGRMECHGIRLPISTVPTDTTGRLSPMAFLVGVTLPCCQDTPPPDASSGLARPLRLRHTR